MYIFEHHHQQCDSEAAATCGTPSESFESIVDSTVTPYNMALWIPKVPGPDYSVIVGSQACNIQGPVSGSCYGMENLPGSLYPLSEHLFARTHTHTHTRARAHTHTQMQKCSNGMVV